MEKVVITKLDNLGRGICFVNNKITFVPNTLPEEEVEIELTKERKKYNEGVVTKYLKASPKRVVPICPYFNSCSGCDLMHLKYLDTLFFKKEKTEDLLYKYAHLKQNVEIEYGSSLGYRNKITLKVVNKKIGYFKSKSHNLVEVQKCFLANNVINDIIPHLPLLNINNGEITIRCNKKGEVILSITSLDKVSFSKLIELHQNLIGIVVNDKTLYGQDYFLTSINELEYKVSYNSFFQVNASVMGLIFDYLNSTLKSGDKLLDLYCGVGTIGLAIAHKFKEIYGVEVVKNAILNAKDNALLNNVSHTKYLCGKVENLLDKLPSNLDLLVLDPPRSGLDTKIRDFILNLNTKNILYISCNPLTLARDLAILKERYKIDSIKIFDMFPYTEHIECVCVLQLR